MKQKLFETKQYLARKEKRLGIDHLTYSARNVYAFIADKDDTTISKIDRHDFFSNTSLSTIKRAVKILEVYELIEITPCILDNRNRLITIKA
jgi:DNA-binding MarR family transcriptional regulator